MFEDQSNKDVQLVMNLKGDDWMTIDNFVVAPCNEHAFRMISRCEEWSRRRLVLYGSSSSGKTHLASVWQQYTGAIKIAIDAFDPSYLPDPDQCMCVILEDADQYIYKDITGSSGVMDKEKTLLHYINLLENRGQYLLISSKEPPARWGISMKELSSRLNLSSVIKISSPDDKMVARLLSAMFAERHIKVSDKLINYLASRIERDFGSLRRTVDLLDSYCLSNHKPLSIFSAKEILSI